MTPTQIKGHIFIKGYETIESYADSIGERRDVVSQTINYIRRNERVRHKIEQSLNIRFDKRPLKKQPSE